MKTVYKGKLFTVKQYKEQYGRTFEICERNPSVEIIPISKDKKIWLINQIRPNYPDGIYSFPGGRVEKGQSLEEAAQRELQEEIGYKAGELKLFMENFKSNTFKYDVYVYIGRDLTKSKLPQDIDERITVEKKTLEEVVKLALSGNFFPDINALAALRFNDAVQNGRVTL